MEGVAQAAFWLAMAATGVASVAYWVHVIGLRVTVRRLATEAGDGPGVPAVETGSSGWSEPAGRLGAYATRAAVALLVLWGLARWQAVDHAPWSNMYEFTTALAGTIAAFSAAFEQTYVKRSGRRSAQALGGLAMPLVLAMLVVAALFFPADIRPLVPALQNSDLLAVHVALMILSYGALSVSFAAAVMYLAQGSEGTGRFPRLPRIRTLDDIAYRSVMVGFPLLAAGIALGAYWADHAWGRYWGWDPKETSALVTLLIYGVYLHMRGLRNWAGTRSAWVLVAAFGAVMFTYFVVNLWVSGLHSYAGV
ncbi:MAG TPA: c-type cytochrome biogenesis protein CcsB [Dehalococcoidia bacterium]|nr:c-type cytochrome biogenesis protein CcsB [Dehalococcoidia bacterium]